MQKFVSYISGWLSSLSWLVGVASAMFLAGNIIPTLISLEHPSFVPTLWQGYLFVVAICLTCFTVNGFLAKHLPLLEGFVLVFMLVAFFSLVVVLLVLSPKISGAEVFQSFTPDLGSVGTLELISAQILLFYSLLGSDSTAHMAKETEDAALIIPRAMVGSYTVMGLMNLIILVAFCFCWVDPEAYETTTTGYAFLQVFISATGSARGAVALTTVMIVLIIMSVTNFMASTSRQVFAFARDDGLPFRSFVAKVNPRTLTPLNSLIVVFLFVVLISLIGLGSTV